MQQWLQTLWIPPEEVPVQRSLGWQRTDLQTYVFMSSYLDNLELFCIEDLFFQQSIALIWIIHNMDLLKSLARELVVRQNTSVTMAINSMESFGGSVCTVEFGMVACQLAKVCVIRVSSWNFILGGKLTVRGRVDFIIIIIGLIFGDGGGGREVASVWGGGGKLRQFGGGGKLRQFGGGGVASVWGGGSCVSLGGGELRQLGGGVSYLGGKLPLRPPPPPPPSP